MSSNTNGSLYYVKRAKTCPLYQTNHDRPSCKLILCSTTQTGHLPMYGLETLGNLEPKYCTLPHSLIQILDAASWVGVL